MIQPTLLIAGLLLTNSSVLASCPEENCLNLDHAFNELQAAEQVLVVTNSDLHASVRRKAAELSSKEAASAQFHVDETTGATPKGPREHSPD
jgi:hypothetical protein